MEILTVTSNVVKYLREKIISWEIKPGEKLNLSEICIKLGVSGPPVREAFRIVEHEQLMVTVPRKGTYVTQVNSDNLRSIYEVREMIECFAIELMEKKNLSEVKEMSENSSDGTPAIFAFDGNLGYFSSLIDFHSRLVYSANNSLLMYLYRSISSNLARYQFMFAEDAGLAEDSQEAHMEIQHLIEGGQYDKAKHLLRSHIRNFVSLFVDKMQKEHFLAKVAGEP